MGTVVGWGLTENFTVSSVLQQANFPVADFYTCVKSNPFFFGRILTERSFCAGYRNGTGLCQGDSGGSMSFNENGIYYIRGIVSVGQAKQNLITKKFECDSTQYTIFTDVAQYLPWIVDNTFSGLLTPVNVETDFSICGELSPRPTPLITNSYDAHHWPWHAAIYHDGEFSHPEYKCGGTVISSKAILTAAHCVQNDANKISVYLGRQNLGVNENSAQTFRVAQVIAHPEYKAEQLHNDIAIIKLSSDAIFNRYVRPVCLWKSSNTDLSEIVGKSGTVVGWGLTEAGEMSTVLREATAPVVSVLDCLQSNRDIYGHFLTETNFCAGHRNGTSTCSGDTGGSMSFEQNDIYYIRGIVSVTVSKIDKKTDEVVCDPMQYIVFTDVAKYLQWIKDNQ